MGQNWCLLADFLATLSSGGWRLWLCLWDTPAKEVTGWLTSQSRPSGDGASLCLGLASAMFVLATVLPGSDRGTETLPWSGRGTLVTQEESAFTKETPFLPHTPSVPAAVARAEGPRVAPAFLTLVPVPGRVGSWLLSTGLLTTCVASVTRGGSLKQCQ